MAMLDLPAGRSGVLPNQYIDAAVAAGVIHAGEFTIPHENVQPASLDLRLGEVAYRIRCSFLPGRSTVERRVKEYVIDELDLRREGAVLETNLPYLIPLKECLALPADVRAKANPKSSTGRADVFTRVITDESSRFDEVAPGYSGGLYLEVVPLSFPVRVREGLSLNQLRLSVGATSLSDPDLLEVTAASRSCSPRAPRCPRSGWRCRTACCSASTCAAVTAGRSATAPWQCAAAGPDEGRRHRPGRLLGIGAARGGRPDRARPQELLPADVLRGGLDPAGAGRGDDGLRPDERRAAHALRGLLRPRFRLRPGRRPCARSTAALEVRAHDVPFMIENGQQVCKLTFERMLEEPTLLYGRGIGSNYQQQTETLGKHFRRPEH